MLRDAIYTVHWDSFEQPICISLQPYFFLSRKEDPYVLNHLFCMFCARIFMHNLDFLQKQKSQKGKSPDTTEVGRNGDLFNGYGVSVLQDEEFWRLVVQ